MEVCESALMDTIASLAYTIRSSSFCWLRGTWFVFSYRLCVEMDIGPPTSEGITFGVFGSVSLIPIRYDSMNIMK